MKSNKCLFSKTVFKSNILRFLPFAAPLLIAELKAFPLALYNSGNRFDLSTFRGVSLASDIISMLFAGLFVLLVFSYLFKPNACNAFHAFPVGRKALFTTGVISSYVLLVVPQLLAFGAGIPIIMRYGLFPSTYITLGIVSIFGTSLVALATAVLAVMLAGNFFAAVVLYGVVNFLYVAARTLLYSAVSEFGIGIGGGMMGGAPGVYLSPLAQLVFTKGTIGSGLKSEQQTLLNDYYKFLIIYAVAAIVILAVSWLLYKIRRLEAAGDMVAFKIEIPVLSVIASVFGGAFAAALLGSIFSFGNLGLMVSYIIFTLFFYFGAQMVIKRTAKVFSAKNFVIWALAAFITLGATLGLAVYETNLVPSKNIKNIVVNTSYDFEPEREDYVLVADLHRALIKNETKGRTPVQVILGTVPTEKRSDEAVFDSKEEYVGSYTVNLTYTLTSGRVIERYYSVDYDSNKEIDALVDKLEQNNAAQTVFDRLDKYDIKIKGCTVSDYSTENESSATLNEKEAKELYELCKADVNAQKEGFKTTKEVNEELMNSSYNISFTFTVENDKDFEELTAESYFSDFTYSSIEYYSYDYLDGNEKEDRDILLNVGNIKYGGEAEKFINKKLNKQ